MNASVSHIIVAPASCRCRAGILPARVPRREASATAAETAALRMDQDQDAKYCRHFVLYLLGGDDFRKDDPMRKAPGPLPKIAPGKRVASPEPCARQGSYTNRYRLQFCAIVDKSTAHDPLDDVARCRHCGQQTIQCRSCSWRVHWMESPCPRCGADQRQRWLRAAKGLREAV